MWVRFEQQRINLENSTYQSKDLNVKGSERRGLETSLNFIYSEIKGGYSWFNIQETNISFDFKNNYPQENNELLASPKK